MFIKFRDGTLVNMDQVALVQPVGDGTRVVLHMAPFGQKAYGAPSGLEATVKEIDAAMSTDAEVVQL
jgi:hypothetical protein